MSDPGRRAGVVAVLAAVVGAGAFASRHLLAPVAWPNDLGLHEAMVRWAADRVAEGEVPMDGWFPALSGGLPQFHHYQSAPHLLTALLAQVVGVSAAVRGTLWLLVAVFPVAVYVGGRALGLGRRAALGAAVAAPLLRSATGYGFEPFSSMWLGNGLWTQAWGAVVAPLALGWGARWVRDGEAPGRAVAAVAACLVAHLPTGWMVVVVSGLWWTARPARWRSGVVRTAVLLAGAAAASAVVWGPFLVDRWAVNASSFDGQGDFADSFGWRRVGGWLLAGDLFDAGRLPILAAVAALGLVVVVDRWATPRPGDRELAILAVVATVLFVGRDPFGPVLALVPGSSQVFLHRALALVQLAGIWLVGVGLERLAAAVEGRIVDRSRGPRAAPAVAVALAVVLVLAPAARSTGRAWAEDATWARAQQRDEAAQEEDLRSLVAEARERGPGRIYAGPSGVGVATARIGRVPVAIWLAHEGHEALGFTLRVSGLVADLEAWTDGTSLDQLAVLGVRWVVTAEDEPAPMGATPVARRGRWRLWRVPGGGSVTLAGVAGEPLQLDHGQVAERVLPWLATASPDDPVRPLDLGGRTPLPSGAASVEGAGDGRVAAEVDLVHGRVDATVRWRSASLLVVRANWHPRWRATVDGEAAPVVAVTPTWLAVEVPAGRHQVAVRYRSVRGLPGLAALAVAVPAAIAGLNRRRCRGRR
ncbi:MAG: hypothetical protein KDA97_13185 [Acidimicrobiales bacterium]|nr:hypothetical protein [Acidimicrobiales bacterium]